MTMVPAGIIAGFAVCEFFAAVSDAVSIAAAAHANIENSTDAALPIFYACVEAMIAVLFFGFAFAMLVAAVVEIVDAEIHSDKLAWQHAFARAWRNGFTIFRQNIIKIILVISISIIFSGITSSGVSSFSVVFFIAYFLISIWLLISAAFGAQAIVCEQSKAIRGLLRSLTIVRGRWWRVFLMLLLAGLLARFVFSLIGVPFVWFSIAPFLIHLNNINTESENLNETIRTVFPILSSMGWALGMFIALTAGLVATVESVFKTILYYDLRGLHGEFTTPVDGGAKTSNLI